MTGESKLAFQRQRSGRTSGPPRLTKALMIVTHLVTLRQEDLFEADFSEADVVTLYLLSSLDLKLRPRLLAELKPGTRIVSHHFHMGDWKPEKTEQTTAGAIHLWRVPERGDDAPPRGEEPRP